MVETPSLESTRTILQEHHDSLKEVATELERVHKLVQSKLLQAEADRQFVLAAILRQETSLVWTAMTVARNHADFTAPLAADAA